ncbi:hypothetical protein Terro_3124 [Terriglobus roseus DSM 18391]|uniref:Uncharacterized protein n=1 Tax=Terriglobus roseus (strain DSM 18391 / NRRL B-41598 / KBS 63) TaxID=926566 RepID=I3ZJD6_TERRK|nr:hypothetical protein Terro_3124 [Terriglobus roseus DSM 18391]
MAYFTEAEESLLKEFFLTCFPNPERNGCPDELALKAFAEGTTPKGSTSVLSHVSSCSECYDEYVHYRMDMKSR